MPKKKQRRVTAQEKLEIMKLVSEGKTAYAIAKKLERSQATVGKVIEELKTTSLKAFNQDVSSIPENTSIEPIDYIETDVYQNVVRSLIKSGLDVNVAKQRIAKICAQAQKKGIESISEEDLYNTALTSVNGSELFINRSSNNEKGVSAITQAASQAGDDAKKSQTNLDKNIDNDRIYKV